MSEKAVKKDSAGIGEAIKDLNTPGQIKACLFNLVVYAQEEKRAAYLQELERTILDKFPCRIIFIEKSEKDEDLLDVSINTQIADKVKKRFNYDEILIRSGKNMLSRVPFLVIPNLAPDLPIYLLWGQDPTADKKILPKLEGYASKLIFDSECTSSLRGFATEMLNLMKSRKTDVMDLNWASIAGWRDALATVFNNQECVEKLKTAPTISITYNEKKTEFARSHQTKAIYLQAWLASCLGWEYLSKEFNGNSGRIYYKNETSETVVSLIGEERDSLSAGAIIGFEASHDGYLFQVVRRRDRSKVNVHTTRNDRCELPYTLSLPEIKQRSTFMREIFYQSVNDHYRKMLTMIAQGEWES